MLTAVALTGKAASGGVLTAAVEPASATGTYISERSASAEGPFTPIDGETASTYTVKESDVDSYLRVTVTASGNYSGAKTSAGVLISSLKLDAVPVQETYLDG